MWMRPLGGYVQQCSPLGGAAAIIGPNPGEVPERLNGLVSKTSMALVVIGGSNPPLSA